MITTMNGKNDILLTPKETKAFLNMSIPTLNKLVRQGVFHKYRFPESKRVYYKRAEIISALQVVDKKEERRLKLLAIILKDGKTD